MRVILAVAAAFCLAFQLSAGAASSAVILISAQLGVIRPPVDLCAQRNLMSHIRYANARSRVDIRPSITPLVLSGHNVPRQ